MLRRHESAFSGLDLWIPPSHYARADMVDRAIGALLGAIDLAGDLATLVGGVSRAVVSVEFPAQADAAALDAARARADVRGTIVADHAWPTRLAQENSGTQVVREGGAILVGLDPAAVLAAGDEPATAASRLGNLVGSARLSDLSAVGRVAPGEGRLDLPAYRIALETAGYTAPVVLDLRGVARGAERIEDIMHRWHW